MLLSNTTIYIVTLPTHYYLSCNDIMVYILLAVVYFTLGKRLHALDDSISFPEGQEFINMSDTINRNIMKLIFYPSFIFKTFPNKLWKEALKSQQRVNPLHYAKLSIIILIRCMTLLKDG